MNLVVSGNDIIYAHVLLHTSYKDSWKEFSEQKNIIKIVSVSFKCGTIFSYYQFLVHQINIVYTQFHILI